MAWGSCVAIVALVIGMVALGPHWTGYERFPGVWVDGVSLARWFVCWAMLALLALVSARRLSGWAVRLLALTPLVAWIVWQLRTSALGPIAMLVYVLPTTLVWSAALWAGARIGHWLARSPNTGNSAPTA